MCSQASREPSGMTREPVRREPSGTTRVSACREPSDVPVDCYALFSSHTDAMALYEEVRARGIEARISPTPRAARATCGVALLFSPEVGEKVQQAAADIGVTLEGLVELPRQIDAMRDRYC